MHFDLISKEPIVTMMSNCIFSKVLTDTKDTTLDSYILQMSSECGVDLDDAFTIRLEFEHEFANTDDATLKLNRLKDYTFTFKTMFREDLVAKSIRAYFKKVPVVLLKCVILD